MGIGNHPDDILIVTLSQEPHVGAELEELTNIVCEGRSRDVVVDFSGVEMLTSESICGLMILDKLLKGSGHKLVLYNLPSAIKQIFVRTGLLVVFDLADDELDALQHIEDKNTSMAEF